MNYAYIHLYTAKNVYLAHTFWKICFGNKGWPEGGHSKKGVRRGSLLGGGGSETNDRTKTYFATRISQPLIRKIFKNFHLYHLEVVFFF